MVSEVHERAVAVLNYVCEAAVQTMLVQPKVNFHHRLMMLAPDWRAVLCDLNGCKLEMIL